MRVRIRNFQSIRDISFDIEGFTVVVGNSNIGKSAIMRALHAALRAGSGHQFVRTGEAFASVEIEDDDLHVLWEKGKSVNRYFINRDPIPLDKVNREVPEAIVKAGYADIVLKDRKVRLSPQHAHQRDGNYFLLDQSPAVVAEVLAQLSRLETMMKAARGAESDIRSLKSDVKVREKDLQATSAKVAKMAALGAVSDRIDVLRQTDRSLREAQTRLTEVRGVAADLKRCRAVLQCVSRGVPTPTNPPDVGPYAQIQALGPTHRKCLAAVKVLGRSIATPALPSTPQGLSTVQEAHRFKQGLLKGLGKTPPTIPNLPSWGVVKDVQDAEDLRKRAVQVGVTVQQEGLAAESERIAALDEIHSVEQALGKCPMCERVFDHGH